MNRVFVDSNVFLRFFTTEDMDQHRRVVNLLHRAADGEIALITGPPVFFEIAWVLRSSYGLPKEQILDLLQTMLEMIGLSVIDAELVDIAIRLAKKCGQDFADAYICVSAEAYEADGIATFNRKHFEKLGAALYPM